MSDGQSSILGGSGRFREKRRSSITPASGRGETALEAIKAIVAGGPLPTVLDFLCRAMEEESRDGVIACIHPVDEAGTMFRDGAAPSLPRAYSEATNGMCVASMAGPCCHAVATQQPVRSEEHTSELQSQSN